MSGPWDQSHRPCCILNNERSRVAGVVERGVRTGDGVAGGRSDALPAERELVHDVLMAVVKAVRRAEGTWVGGWDEDGDWATEREVEGASSGRALLLSGARWRGTVGLNRAQDCNPASGRGRSFSFIRLRPVLIVFCCCVAFACGRSMLRTTKH